MKSLEEQFCDQVKGCCCCTYFYGFIVAVILIFGFIIPAIARLL